MKINQLKRNLREGKLCVGSWITLGNEAIAEIFSNAGFDWVVVDLEHSTISIEQAGSLIRTVDLSGSVPLVRLTSNDSNLIKRVMDAGAHGIVVPNVNSGQEAADAVAATRYAPEGRRGVGLARAQDYGSGFEDYLQWQKRESIVIVQIEHVAALANLETILSVPGVDGFIIGPYDLSCSMGIPGQFDHSDFLDAMNHILETAVSMNCPAGLHIVEPDINKLREVVQQGYRFIAYSVDIRILDVCARHAVESLKTLEL